MVGKIKKQYKSRIKENIESSAEEIELFLEQDDSKYITIIDPDGQEIQVLRNIDITQRGPVRKKAALANYKRKGFYARWITNRDLKLYSEYLNRGFRFVKGFPKVYGGIRKDGTPYYTYLVEIPAKWYWEFFEKPKQEHNYRTTMSMLQRKDVENHMIPATHYAANGTPNSISNSRGMGINEFNKNNINDSALLENNYSIPTSYDSSWDQK